MKSISTINPAIMENTDDTIVKERAPVIDTSVRKFCNFTINRDHSNKQEQSSTPADILVDIFNPYNSANGLNYRD